MQPDLNALGAFQEHFARYLNYLENRRCDLEILNVSFQFLTNNQESQLAEVVGLVENQNKLEFVKG